MFHDKQVSTSIAHATRGSDVRVAVWVLVSSRMIFKPCESIVVCAITLTHFTFEVFLACLTRSISDDFRLLTATVKCSN